jgi:hypothetical protein
MVWTALSEHHAACVVVQVDHEPSVPTLEALLLSCLAFAAVQNLSVLLAGCMTLTRSQLLQLQSAAAVVAVVLELLVSVLVLKYWWWLVETRGGMTRYKQAQ